MESRRMSGPVDRAPAVDRRLSGNPDCDVRLAGGRGRRIGRRPGNARSPGPTTRPRQLDLLSIRQRSEYEARRQ